MAQSPTVRRLQLGRELRRLREVAGVTREASAAELECDVSKISKVENGRMTLALAEVKALLQLYGGAGDEAEQILTIAREARKRSTHRVPEWLRAYVGLESETDEIKAFQIDLIPGLVQTEAYARAVTQAADPTRDPAEVDRLVVIRRERQARLQGDDSPRLWFVIDEAAIRRVVGGPEVMSEQLDHLLELSQVPTVSIQVLPFAAGAHAAMGTAFTIFRLPEPPDGGVVVLEGLWSAEYIDKEPLVVPYTAAFDRLRVSALNARDTLSLIEKARTDLG